MSDGARTAHAKVAKVAKVAKADEPPSVNAIGECADSHEPSPTMLSCSPAHYRAPTYPSFPRTSHMNCLHLSPPRPPPLLAFSSLRPARKLHDTAVGTTAAFKRWQSDRC